MSTASVKNTFYALCKADSALTALLTADPNAAGEPAIFNARMNEMKAPVYDSITYRVSSSLTDERFRPQPAGAAYNAVEDVYIDCEIWSQATDSQVVSDVGERLDALFTGQQFPLSDSSGSVFFSWRIAASDDNWDDKLKAHFSLRRYRWRIQNVST